MGDHSLTKIDYANHLLLDQPLVRLPYELLHTNFRAARFTVEKEGSTVKKTLKDSANAALKGGSTPDDVLKNLDTMIARMRGIKRKLSACADEEARLYQQVDTRQKHLNDLQNIHAFEDVKYEQWSRVRLDRLLVDYLMRQGYGESAKALAAKKGIEDLVDIQTFEQMNRVRERLLDHSVKEALDWCTENKKELRKMDSSLEFNLRFQQYIELVRTQNEDKLLEAIGFARKYLFPFRETWPTEHARAATLLAYPPNAGDSEHKQMYSAERWKYLANLFVDTHNKLLGLPSFPVLHIALQSGLSALKTPACHSSHGGGSAGSARSTTLTNSVCPICSRELNELARNVPYAHHSQSHVESDLMMLPSGRVYARKRLEEHARKAGLSDGTVMDLWSGTIVSMSEAKKIYIT
ncbi:CTLH/CRA C-terminal to lish motif domain-domain-containing protein [Coniella lustricola]|uniref:CTLH/CRA C-terminal to lish motif domain-domain-containing protein n=1 Tax=Coniella lustricola TaxID=2025994 RepID=A0A2T3AK26_9PEZI|nr:CTLH/CRA C-terminal to lish motif domain-domain-containing protein [Coniella lustricola]